MASSVQSVLRMRSKRPIRQAGKKPFSGLGGEGRPQELRRVATRYGKLLATFFGFVTVAATAQLLR
jgi:hypothetical protein